MGVPKASISTLPHEQRAVRIPPAPEVGLNPGFPRWQAYSIQSRQSPLKHEAVACMTPAYPRCTNARIARRITRPARRNRQHHLRYAAQSSNGAKLFKSYTTKRRPRIAGAKENGPAIREAVERKNYIFLATIARKLRPARCRW